MWRLRRRRAAIGHVEQVDAVTDLVNSAVALGVQDIAKRKEKITLISGAGTFDLTGKACSPTGVHWTYDTWSLGKGIAEALPQLVQETG